MNSKNPEARTTFHSRRNLRNISNLETTMTRPASSRPTQPVQSRIEHYALGRQLGRGAYAVVRLGTHRTSKQHYAVKTYEKLNLTDLRRKKGVQREIKIMQKLDHPNTIKLVEAIDSPNQINLVMEYVGGTSLNSYVRRKAAKKLDEEEAKYLFKQVVQAIDYCHNINVSHRDIKLENILLDKNNKVKVIDFGFSTYIPSKKNVKMFCGTPSYMAPEIIANKEYAGPPADIWALGVLLYSLLAGVFPFKGTNDRELYKKISRGTFEFPASVKGPARDLIRGMMRLKPENRLSCCEILNQAWLKTPQLSLCIESKSCKEKEDSLVLQKFEECKV